MIDWCCPEQGEGERAMSDHGAGEQVGGEEAMGLLQAATEYGQAFHASKELIMSGGTGESEQGRAAMRPCHHRASAMQRLELAALRFYEALCAPEEGSSAEV